MAILDSLMLGGYTPDIYDIDPAYVPDIEEQYVICYQCEGKVYKEVITAYEGDDLDKVFKKAIEFARSHDTLAFWRDPDYQYLNPKTGEEVDTPYPTGKDYYEQPIQPYITMFAKCETDELPF